MFSMLRAGYNAVLSAFTSGDSVPLQAEKDGTLRAGLRPRGHYAGTTGVLYQTGILVLTAGNLTITGEDGNSTGSLAYPAGVLVIGPLTVTAASATFLGYK